METATKCKKPKSMVDPDTGAKLVNVVRAIEITGYTGTWLYIMSRTRHMIRYKKTGPKSTWYYEQDLYDLLKRK